jgi:hypothetical protein
MQRLVALLLILGALAGPAAVADDRRRLGDDEAAAFRGVGRLNVAGRRFCTAALVSDRLAVTAAHCLYHPRTHRPVPLAELRFVAGQLRDEFAALRRVVRAAVPADFVFDGEPSFDSVRRDIALLELDAAVTPEEAPAFPPGEAPGPDALIEIVSYGRDRAQAPSIQDACRIGALIGEVAALDCGVNLGGSGAPVFAEAKAQRFLWAVVSSTGTLAAGGEVTLAVRVAPELAALEAALAEALPTPAAAEP